MKILGRNDVSSCAAPALVVFAIDRKSGWRLRDVDSATWTIFDPSGAATEGPNATVTADCPAGDRIGQGRFVIPWTVPADAPRGAYRVAWDHVFDPGDPPERFDLAFEVIDASSGPMAESYASISSMRCEGFGEGKISDEKLARRLKLASALFDGFTCSSFSPAGKRVRLSGEGGQILFLREPIIAVGDIDIEFSDLVNESTTEVSRDSFRVFNRHLSDSLLLPDDRRNPKIERIAGSRFGISRWPQRPQNVIVEGVFGFTDPDGSTVGATPDAVQLATQLLAARYIDSLSSARRRDRLAGHLVTEERTVDQQIKFARPTDIASAVGTHTGDPEIDTLIEMFRAPYAAGVS